MNTASTPGIARASATSSPRTSACAIGLRTKTAQAAPSGSASSM